MPKRVYIPVIIILFITALLFLAPRLLDVDTVRSKVAELVSVKSGWQVDADNLDWYWLPTPHFSLRNTTISKNNIRLVLPETRIFPLWQSLLQNRIELSEVMLLNPELHIESFGQDSDQAGEGNLFRSGITLPQAGITIKDGTVVFSEGALAEYPHLFPLSIDKIGAAIKSTPERFDFKFTGESSYFSFLDMDGSFRLEDHGYNIDYEISNLLFNKLLPALGYENLLPVESAISLRGNITGNGPENFAAAIEGDMPCFVSPSATESFLLDCGSGKLTISKNSAGFTVNIDELKMKSPGLLLKGEIARMNAETGAANTEPVWLLNLEGNDLDLTAIRKGVLALWGNNHVAKTVTDIVLGGKAGYASYYFKAPASGFEHIEEMKIYVDVDEAAVHPPATPLFLSKAHGSIAISNGYLSGQGLSARLGESRGENCSIYLDLAHRQGDFRLSLDIDADLAPLPGVLDKLVQHESFRRGLKRFSDVAGRAEGHLSIGETLDDLQVEVKVVAINGGAKHETLPHAFRIRSGSLSVFPESLEWRDIKGVIGSHTIRGATGKISWDDDVFIEIKEAQATLDSAVLLNDLSQSSLLPSGIATTITNAEGIVELNKATMSGKIDEPENWRYSLDVTTSGSRWTSPLLPRPILAERIRANISRDNIDLISGKVWILEQPLLLEGSFNHNNFANWRFWTMLSGTIREPLAEWIREKNWVPVRYFPKIPCTLDKLKIQWDADKLNLSGSIAAGMGGVTSPSVRLQLESNDSYLKIQDLFISSPGEQGHLSLDYLKKDPGRLTMSWQGFVNSATVLKLLNTNVLSAERIEGDFSVKHSKGEVDFTGWANVHDIGWFFNDSRPDFLIRELKISGESDGSIKIDPAEAEMADEKLALNGRISLKPDKVTFDLGLDSEKISNHVARAIAGDIKLFSAGRNGDKAFDETSVNKELQGVLHFKTARFVSEPEVFDDTGATSAQYVLAPANGFISIDSGTGINTLDLKNSNVCGLDISGTFNLAESRNESSLVMFTDNSSPPLFEDVIPCFGLQNTFIDGAFNLDVNFKGQADLWQSGNGYLYSEGGYIYQLGFLSKVFRVINLRDIISGKDMPDFAKKGFAYAKIDISSHVENNALYIDKAFIDGEGLNIFGQGTIDLTNWSADLTLMLAPLKTVDALIGNIPLIGKVVGGKDKAIISIPVSLKGNLRDPVVTVLPPDAIGESFLNLIANTLSMPFQIISPLLNSNGQ